MTITQAILLATFTTLLGAWIAYRFGRRRASEDRWADHAMEVYDKIDHALGSARASLLGAVAELNGDRPAEVAPGVPNTVAAALENISQVRGMYELVLPGDTSTLCELDGQLWGQLGNHVGELMLLLLTSHPAGDLKNRTAYWIPKLERMIGQIDECRSTLDEIMRKTI